MRTRKDKRGYVHVRVPGHPLAYPNGEARLHRVLWYDAHGPIPKGHEIHHKNGNKSDNRLENLECIPIREHRRKHAPALVRNRAMYDAARGVPHGAMIQLTCKHCGKGFQRKLRDYRRNMGHSGQTFEFCSMRCVAYGRRRKRDAGVEV